MQYPPNQPYGQNPYGNGSNDATTSPYSQPLIPQYPPQPEQPLYEHSFMGTWVKVYPSRIEYKPPAKPLQSIPINQITDTRLITGEIVVETVVGPYRILTNKNKDVQRAIWQAQAPYPQQSPIPPMPPQQSLLPQSPQRSKKGKNNRNFLIGCGVLVFVLMLCGLCSAIANTGNHSSSATTDTTTPTSASLVIHVPTKAATARPTIAPTPTSVPPTPTPVPQPTAAPTSPPVATGVNGNPWGYDFNVGTVITDPPSGFCAYFNCIASFWSGTGYVTECADGTYSKSGGHTGSCSRHGGDAAILYSH